MDTKKLFVALACVGALTGCDVDVKDKGEMPEVEVKEGRAPDVDVTGPEVDVNREERSITVPDVEVNKEQKSVTVPDVDVKVPRENEQ